MKTKLTKGILLILSLLCILCVPVTPVYAAQQGTDGSELQVVKAEQLEIQLGTSWSGVEFQLKTDAGVYPGTVKVGTDGVLRLEIGGSSQYILTCMNSSTSLPEPEDTADSTDRTQAPATTEQSPESNEKAESGIPTLHIILFAGGMVIAIGTLIVMQILKKKRENKAPDDEEDEQPALEYQPVGLPEPCGVIPECTIHCCLTCISNDIGNETEHTDEETGNHGVFTCLWSNLLKEDTHCKYGYHGWSQE